MDVMIDFHYSDWWADPAQQNKPAAWKDKTLPELKKAIGDHTVAVLPGFEGGGSFSQMGASGQRNTSGYVVG